MNDNEKKVLIEIIQLAQREQHRKKMKKARNSRYYDRHKNKILARQKLKNAIFNEFLKQYKQTV